MLAPKSNKVASGNSGGNFRGPDWPLSGCQGSLASPVPESLKVWKKAGIPGEILVDLTLGKLEARLVQFKRRS